ncbi:MAG: RNA-directed DNA polymerase [Ruminococcus sp.]|nr:RNA-directed DNA polymerase [Ruminococcus sp.]
MHKKKYDIEKVTGIPWKRKKSYRYLYTLACQKGVILKAFKRMKRGKSRRKDIQKAEEDIDAWVEKIQRIIQNTKPAGWKVEDPEMEFRPPKHNPVFIREAGKTRIIYVPTMVELWIQHVIVLILEPIIEGSSYHHSYSSFPNRGSHRGMKAMRRWIRSGKGIRNFAQCDIRHFYDHAKYRFVREKLVRRIHDILFIHLIDVCLKWFPDKLPLGFYLSQWLANFLLQELDYILKCKVKVAHYVRYMDNFTLADDNKKKLHRALVVIRQWLGQVRLKMKGDWQVFRFEYTKKNGKKTGKGASAMGWLFFRDRVLIRKHTIIHIARMARKLHNKKMAKEKYPLKLCKGFISLMGWITHSDTYDWYLMYIKPYVSVRSIKRIISKMDKEANKNARLENRKLLLTA